MQLPLLRRALGVLLVMALAQCSSGGQPGASANPPPPSASYGGTLIRAVCLDGTGSSPAAFSETVRSLLVQRIKIWVPEATVQDKVQSAAHPGLVLIVRVVATASPTTNDGYGLIINISRVPALWPPPDVQATDFQQRRLEYLAQRQLVEQARKKAMSEAADGARRLAGFTLKHAGESSGVTACASTLAITVTDLLQTVPKPYHRSFMVASDLDDNVAIQIAGSFDQATMTLLITCPSGDIGRCDRLKDTFVGHMKDLDVGPVTSLRAELADRAVADWLDTTNVGEMQ